MKMLHKDCGGEINEDPNSPPYHYNPDTDTANPDDPTVPVYRCGKCVNEILGDAQIELSEDNSDTLQSPEARERVIDMIDNPDAWTHSGEPTQDGFV